MSVNFNSRRVEKTTFDCMIPAVSQLSELVVQVKLPNTYNNILCHPRQ